MVAMTRAVAIDGDFWNRVTELMNEHGAQLDRKICSKRGKKQCASYLMLAVSYAMLV